MRCTSSEMRRESMIPHDAPSSMLRFKVIAPQCRTGTI